MTIPPTGDVGFPAAPYVGAPSFAVTAPPELTLAADRTGSTSFTVTNLAGRPKKARLIPRGQAGAQDAWLSVAGPTEVPIPVAATLTATVLVRVPPEVPPGRHTLYLEVVAEDDTESVTGQSVSFVVPPAPVVKRKFPWWLLIVAAVVLALIIGLVVFLLTRGGDDPEPGGPGPVNTVRPSAGGILAVNQIVSSTDGVWSGQGTLTFTRQWQRCDTTGRLCQDIPRATGTRIRLTVDEQNTMIKVVVTATDAEGSNTAESQLIGPVGPPVLR